MTNLKYRFKINVTQLDSHVHFNLFVAPGWNKTYAQTGSLVMRPEEFREFTERLSDQTISNTLKEHRKWILPEQAPEFFSKWFTIREHAELSEVPYPTAGWRLGTLTSENKITSKIHTIDSGHKCLTFRTLLGCEIPK